MTARCATQLSIGRRLGVLLALLSATGAALAADPAAYVLKQEGRWSAGAQPITIGQALSAAEIAAGLRGSTPADRLTLIVAGKPHTCVERCDGSLLAKVQPEGRGRLLADAVLAPAMKIFHEKPDFPAMVVVRGRVADGVAPLDAGRIDLAEVVRDCRTDRVDLRFQTIDTQPARTFEPIVVPCEAGRAGSASARGAAPGLYRVDVLQRSGDGYVARGVTAWVLVSRKARAAAAASAFADAVKLTSEWGSDVDPDTAVAVQRAYLQHLAAEEHR